MKHRFSLCRASLWLVLAGFCFSFSSIAGDKIVFGNEKSKVNPDDKSQLSKDTAKNWTKVDNDALGDAMSFRQPQRYDVIDPSKEKERRLKRLEQMNWMFVNPGELTDENDDMLGALDKDPSSALDKDDEKDLMFIGLLDNKRSGFSTKGYGQNGKKDQPQVRPIPISTEDDPTSRSLFVNRTEPKSLHTEDALSFKKTFGTSSGSDAAAISRGAAGVDGLFKSSSSSAFSSMQSRDEFKKFLTGSQGFSSGAAFGGSYDIPKASSGSANPLLSKPADPVVRNPVMDNYGGGVGRYGGMEAQGGWNPGGVSGYGTLQPNLTPRSTAMQPSHSFEPSRARGMGSLGGH